MLVFVAESTESVVSAHARDVQSVAHDVQPEYRSWRRVVGKMASQTVGFAVADEDRERLDRLVEHFGGGNRSAYLRATLKVMESLRRAERLRDLQASNHRRLAEQGIAAEDLPERIREAYKGSRK